MRNNLKYLLVFFLAFIFLPGLTKAAEQQTQVIFIPQEIDQQIIYPSRFVTPEVNTFHYLNYKSVIVDTAWVNKGYYYEIWDERNKPLPHYLAQKLETNVIDLRAVDTTQTKNIRMVVFVPDNKEVLPPGDFVFTYEQGFDWRLLVFAVFSGLLIASILIFSFINKITPVFIFKILKNLKFNKLFSEEKAIKIILALAWVIIIFAGIYGIALGYFIGSWQILYVLIKLPLLFISALIISFLTSYILNLLLGSQEKLAAVFINALSALAITSLILASLAPVLWFMIIIPNKHDIIVLINVLFFGLAGLIGVFYFYQKSFGKNKIGFFIWIILYGVVALQLAWLLRPWVGLLESVDQTIPFLRLYDGNVFIELINILNRILQGKII